MCTININALEMDRQVFWKKNYLHSSKLREEEQDIPEPPDWN